MADTQALWRFLHNPRIKPSDLSQPLLQMARQGIADSCDDYALAVHDWSKLNYRSHSDKRDRVRMTHDKDVGYQLQSCVLVADRDGSPICAPVQNLRTAKGLLSSRVEGMLAQTPHLDELNERVAWLEQQQLGRTLVHVVDRQADSIGHLRRCNELESLWLVRVKAGNTVRDGSGTIKLGQVAATLRFEAGCQVQHKGGHARQWIASTTVVITRAARPWGKDAEGKRKKAVKGVSLKARLVITQVRDEDGKVLAEWFLLSNVPEQVSADRLALWYYWRWGIESYFKLLKQAGQELECWGQESGEAIFKRVLIASQACALAWRLMRAQGQQAETTRAFLIRLSGRQTKRSRPVTASALLAGMYMLFTLNETLEHYSPEEIAQFARHARAMVPG
jgi:hypothetical protein